jgi:hypothetical protein
MQSIKQHNLKGFSVGITDEGIGFVKYVFWMASDGVTHIPD